jgi:uncharacterized protein (UPF0248 family)
MVGLVGKKVCVFYDDTQTVKGKEGVVTNHSMEGIYLDTGFFIPLHRVVRVELR